MKKKVLLTVVIFLAVFGLNAQEIITGIQFNEVIRNELKNNTEAGTLKNSIVSQAALQLPFFDDFSNCKIYPDKEKWIGRSVFVNRDFPQFPTNVGAATFDAIDEKGKVYPNATWVPFEADVMTSRLIRLDSVFDPVKRALGPQDSIYLSFFYQPQGNGDKPESGDTLILDFAYPGDTVFSHIDSVTWSAQYWLTDLDDTIPPLSKLYNPSGMGCNPDIFKITYSTITWTDSVTMPCDSVFGPDTLWQNKWFAEGTSLKEFKTLHGKDFVQVMVPLYKDTNDLKFFEKNFQFRFRNYASIAPGNAPSEQSNCDQWNIDYVYLNYNRNAGDSTYRDIVFSQRAPSFLKNYQAMPYRQYRAGSTTNLLKSQFEMFIANLDDQEHNTSYEYHVRQINGDFSYSYYGGVCNLPPFDFFGFQNCNSGCGAAHACPPVNSAFNFDFSRDTTSYLIRHFISDSSETDVLIDSVSYIQGFYNYFAYDDGTPEFGYGLSPAGSLLAYKFSLSKPDTLRGVQMYFNRTLNNSNEAFFNLKVWQDNNGVPGNELYSGPSVKPKWSDQLYGFSAYIFEEPILLSGVFYVGWQQQSNVNLNIGFDANNNNQDKIFSDTGIGWTVSIIKEGSLLIRPIVGQDMILGTPENKIAKKTQKIKVFPNPAGHYFTVDQSEVHFSPTATIYIYTIYGSLVYERLGVSTRINVAGLPKGMYLIRINNQNRMYTAKLLINH